jgi:hypothetical protein
LNLLVVAGSNGRDGLSTNETMDLCVIEDEKKQFFLFQLKSLKKVADDIHPRETI